MNGYAAERPSLDEDAFGENNAAKVVQAFDYFPKTKPSYQEQTSNGGVWTVVLICASLWLASTEMSRWWKGDTTHSFSVEQGVGHDLQINLDIVVAMRCEDLHINVQDASGDRILAGTRLHKDPTQWSRWDSNRKQHALGASKQDRLDTTGEYQEEDVHDYLGAAKKSKQFAKTPKMPRRATPDSCRVYGSMHGNKVQGDFHITARGHGYMEMGQHLDHSSSPPHQFLRQDTINQASQPSTSPTTSTSSLSDLSIRLSPILWTTPSPPRPNISTSSNTTFPSYRPSTPPTPKRSGRSTSTRNHPLPGPTAWLSMRINTAEILSSRISMPSLNSLTRSRTTAFPACLSSLTSNPSC